MAQLHSPFILHFHLNAHAARARHYDMIYERQTLKEGGNGFRIHCHSEVVGSFRQYQARFHIAGLFQHLTNRVCVEHFFRLPAEFKTRIEEAGVSSDLYSCDSITQKSIHQHLRYVTEDDVKTGGCAEDVAEVHCVKQECRAAFHHAEFEESDSLVKVNEGERIPH